MRNLVVAFFLCLPTPTTQAGWFFDPSTESECVEEYAKSAKQGRLVPTITQKCALAFDTANAQFYRGRALCEAKGLSQAAHIELTSVVKSECETEHPDPICEKGSILDPFKLSLGCIDLATAHTSPYLLIKRKGADWTGVGDDGMT